MSAVVNHLPVDASVPFQVKVAREHVHSFNQGAKKLRPLPPQDIPHSAVVWGVFEGEFMFVDVVNNLEHVRGIYYFAESEGKVFDPHIGLLIMKEHPVQSSSLI
jgi:hypothetical protein